MLSQVRVDQQFLPFPLRILKFLTRTEKFIDVSRFGGTLAHVVVGVLSAVGKAPTAESTSACVALKSETTAEIQKGLLAAGARQGEDLLDDLLAPCRYLCPRSSMPLICPSSASSPLLHFFLNLSLHLAFDEVKPGLEIILKEERWETRGKILMAKPCRSTLGGMFEAHDKPLSLGAIRLVPNLEEILCEDFHA